MNTYAIRDLGQNITINIKAHGVFEAIDKYIRRPTPNHFIVKITQFKPGCWEAMDMTTFKEYKITRV